MNTCNISGLRNLCSSKVYEYNSFMSDSQDASHLANQFLIAMPGMLDPNFAGSVVYMFEHNERGAMGLVINRPTDVDLATLFDKIDLQLEIEALARSLAFFGSSSLVADSSFEARSCERSCGAPPVTFLRSLS